MVEAENVVIKSKFEERYRLLLGDDYDKFIETSLAMLPRAIRVNTLKCDVEQAKNRVEKRGFSLEPIPWCPTGFWVRGERRDVGNLPEHQLGYVYIQEAASMIPPEVLCAQPGEIILDMCSSPGSKASQIASHMNNEGLLVCNDVDSLRLKPLGINLQKLGVTCSIVTLMSGNKLREIQFDRVLVDAPCSGTGTLHKSLKTLHTWNPGVIQKLSGLQFNLLSNAIAMTKPGGTIVYSTCTLEPMENEGVVSRALAEGLVEIESIDLPIKRSPAVGEFMGVAYDDRVVDCLRIYPYDNESEGFFVAKLRKK